MSSQETESVRLRVEGNNFFRDRKYFRAHACYQRAINACSPQDAEQLSTIYANLSATQLYLEKMQEAVDSATKAIEYNSNNVKAYMRRGNALAQSLDWKGAYDDFLAAAKLDPNNKFLREKLQICKKSYTAGKMRMAISSDSLADKELAEAEPFIPKEDVVVFDEEYAKFVMKEMVEDRRPTASVLSQMIKKMKDVFLAMDNIVTVKRTGLLRVVGDTHGQFQDLVNIFEKYGYPSEENPYLFNGDYVDRGSMGIEILITLFAWKLANPNCIYLNRGNHETNAMNSMYGFERECCSKYSRQMFNDMSDLFNTMPLGHMINHKVLVVHGGLFGDESVTVDKVQGFNRVGQPPDSGPLNDILWSDPMDEPGFAPSPRGVTRTFGPDVTERFLANNDLELIIRSHQVQENGFCEMHGGKCITVFSAPNYIGQMGNKGAIVRLMFHEDGSFDQPEYDQFDAQPIPAKYRPMQYSSFGSFF